MSTPKIIGPDKFKVENLPSELYNSIEREHFTLSFEEAFMLGAYVSSLDDDRKLNWFEKMIFKSSIEKTLSSIEMKFNAILKKHNFNVRGCFVKFSNVSPKDKGIQPIFSIKDFLKSIRDSRRIREELGVAVFGKHKGVNPIALPEITEYDYSPVSIILSEWLDAKRFIEIRSFVFGSELYFASQYLWWYYYEQIAKDPMRLINTLQEELAKMQVNHSLIAPDLVVDFWVSGDLKQAKFLEFNPYDQSHPVLFRREIVPGLPLAHYKSLEGLLRFTGKSDSGYENIPFEFVLPKIIRHSTPEEADQFLKEHANGEHAQDVQDMYDEYQVVQLLKANSLVISQKRFR